MSKTIVDALSQKEKFPLDFYFGKSHTKKQQIIKMRRNLIMSEKKLETKTSNPEIKKIEKPEIKELTVGQILKNARLKQKKEIPTAAKKICIRKVYLEALEADARDLLPGHAYTIGFLQNYAEYLRLNPEKLTKQYRLENPEEKPVKATTQEDETIPLYKNKKFIQMQYFMMGVGTMFLVFIVYLIFTLFSSSSDKNIENSQIEPKTLIETPILLENPLVSETIGEQEIETEETNLTEDKQKNIENVEISNQKTDEASITTPQTTNDKINLEAEEDVWVELIDTSNNKIVFSRILKKNERYEMDSNKNILLTIGNAGGLKILVGETEIEKMGPRGMRRSNIQMESKLLLEGKAYKSVNNQ